MIWSEFFTAMNLINAVIATQFLARNSMLGSETSSEVAFGTIWWFVYAGISGFLVLFAGIMSGLTLGLMSLGLVELEILRRSGTPSEKKQAGFSDDRISLRFDCILN